MLTTVPEKRKADDLSESSSNYSTQNQDTLNSLTTKSNNGSTLKQSTNAQAKRRTSTTAITANQSDQKRRQNLRERFRDLSDLIPSLKDLPLKSEAVVLQKSVEYMSFLLDEQRDMEDLISRMEAYLRSNGMSTAL
jgi:hypothetical protein